MSTSHDVDIYLSGFHILYLLALRNILIILNIVPVRLFWRGLASAITLSISFPVSTLIDEDFFMERICEGYTLLWPVIRKLTTHATVA